MTKEQVINNYLDHFLLFQIKKEEKDDRIMIISDMGTWFFWFDHTSYTSLHNSFNREICKKIGIFMGMETFDIDYLIGKRVNIYLYQILPPHV